MNHQVFIETIRGFLSDVNIHREYTDRCKIVESMLKVMLDNQEILKLPMFETFLYTSIKKTVEFYNDKDSTPTMKQLCYKVNNMIKGVITLNNFQPVVDSYCCRKSTRQSVKPDHFSYN